MSWQPSGHHGGHAQRSYAHQDPQQRLQEYPKAQLASQAGIQPTSSTREQEWPGYDYPQSATAPAAYDQAQSHEWQKQAYDPYAGVQQPDLDAAGSCQQQPSYQRQAYAANATEQSADQPLTDSGQPLWKEFNQCDAWYGPYETGRACKQMMCACVNGHRAASGKTNARTGNYGLGYYLDKYPVFGSKPEPKPPAPAAKPKAIGLNNSIVKGLAPKGGGIGKKKKSADDAEKPAYLREMEAWQKQACSSSSRTGSLVK